MSKAEVFKRKVKKGDNDAVTLSRYVYLKEIMVDFFESLSEEMIRLQKELGMYRYEDKDLSEKFYKASKDLAELQRQYVGDDHVAETLGEASDDIQDILLESALLSSWKKKLVAEFAKIWQGYETKMKMF